MIFARIKADEFHACGVFADQSKAADALFGAAEVFHGSPVIGHLTYIHKPEADMSEQDEIDCAMKLEGAVVVL